MYTDPTTLPEFVPSPWAETPVDQLPTCAVNSLFAVAAEWIAEGHTYGWAAHHCGLTAERLQLIIARYPEPWSAAETKAKSDYRYRNDAQSINALVHVMQTSADEKIKVNAATRISRIIERQEGNALKHRTLNVRQSQQLFNETKNVRNLSAEMSRLDELFAMRDLPEDSNEMPEPHDHFSAPPFVDDQPSADPANPVAAPVPVPVNIPNKERPVSRQRNRAFQRAIERDLRKAQKTAQ